jgi:hypothetical protein
MRRYHNWLASLPDPAQDTIRDKSPGERMELIKKMVKDHPVPRAATARFLQVIDVGDFSPFELAAMYETWQSMSPAERQQVDNMRPNARRQAFVRNGEARRIAALHKANSFDEPQWVDALEVVAQNRQIVAVLQEMKNKVEGRPGEILRRQAINFHFLERARPGAVDPARMADFLASFPPWLQTCFDHHSPDEAKRRLTIVYRLVFPPGHEIKEGLNRTAPAEGKQSPSGTSSNAKRPNGKSSSTKGSSPY